MSVPYFKFLSFLFSVDNIEGVSTVKHLHKLTSLIAMLFTVSMYTHLLMGWRRCKQCYYSNHDSSEATKQYGEMEVVDTAQHCRGRVHDTTSGRREGKLQHHPTHTHHQTHHQAPECTLNTQTHIKTHTGYKACLPALIRCNFLLQRYDVNSCSSTGSHLGVFGLQHSLSHHDNLSLSCHLSSTHTCNFLSPSVLNLQQRM